MVRRDIRPFHGRALRLGLGARPGSGGMIELPHGALDLLFAALVVFAQVKRSREAANG